MANSYIKCLDGLRAIAVILVMTYHAHVTHFGWIGVQLFFVLSGFLITGILWKEKAGDTSLSYKFQRFWIRRSLRIFPLYFFYLFLVWVCYLLLHVPEHYPSYISYLVTYTFNFTTAAPRFFGTSFQGDPFYTHLWSLCVEEQFYLIFPFFMLLLPRRVIKYSLVFVICFAPVLRQLLYYYYTENGVALGLVSNTIYTNTITHLDAFFLGGIIPVLSLEKRIRKPARLLLITTIIFFGAGVWNFLTTDSGKFFFNDLGYNQGQVNNHQYVWFYTVLNLFFASLILCLTNMDLRGFFDKFRAFLENGWLVKIGKVSYGMYIYHWAILAYIYEPFLHSENLLIKILLFIPYVFVVYFVAKASYETFEVYFIRLKDTYENNRLKKVKIGS